jgi:diphthamide synthase (EF-2-diphthine--ammonia ligase)
LISSDWNRSAAPFPVIGTTVGLTGQVAGGRVEGEAGAKKPEARMKYEVTLNGEDGEFVAECPSMGVSARSLSPTNALDALRDEIRYRLELCPCTSVGEEYVELEVSGG